LNRYSGGYNPIALKYKRGHVIVDVSGYEREVDKWLAEQDEIAAREQAAQKRSEQPKKKVVFSKREPGFKENGEIDWEDLFMKHAEAAEEADVAALFSKDREEAVEHVKRIYREASEKVVTEGQDETPVPPQTPAAKVNGKSKLALGPKGGPNQNGVSPINYKGSRHAKRQENMTEQRQSTAGRTENSKKKKTTSG
jgi:hypothetical protein